MIDITEKKVPHLFRNKYLRNAGSGSVNTSTQSPGQSTPGASVDIVKTDSATVPTDGNVLSSLRTLLEIRSRIIASTDTDTAPSEDNTLSSLRTLAEIDAAITNVLDAVDKLYLSKTEADIAAEAITFLKGLFVGDNLAFIDANGDAEVKNLVARMKAKVATLEVTGDATTLNLLVQELATIYDLDVTHVATMFQTVIKDYVSSETFIPGLMGEGMKIYKALNGDWNLEIDNVVIRKVMTIFELVVSKIRSVNGGLVISSANGRIKSVAETTGEPAYYVLGIEGDNQFVTDDLVRCQVFTSGQAKYYWIPVASVTDDSILILKSEFADGVAPAPGDDLIQMGNRTNKDRQGFLYLTASEDGKPRFSVMDGVDSTSTVGKSKVILGCLDGMTDTDFPADFQPSGWGLYAMNVFLKGVFLLRNGKSVESEIESAKSDAQTAKDKADTITRLFQEFTVAGGLFESKITEVKEYAKEKAEAAKGEAIDDAAGKYNTKSEITSLISQTKEDISLSVTEKISNVQVGGTNLLRNSSNWRSAGWNGGFSDNGGGYVIDNSVLYNGLPTLKTDVGTGLMHPWLKLQNGVWYTYSAMVKCNKTVEGGTSAPLHYWSGKDNLIQGKIEFLSCDASVVADEWKLIHSTFRLTEDADSFRPIFYRGANESTFYWIAYFKLERGNKATDWTPAPEDVQTQITANASEIEVNRQGISLKASQEQVNGIGNRLTTAEGNLTVQAGQIAAQVSSVDALTGRMNSAEVALRPDNIWLGIKSNVSTLVPTYIKQIDTKWLDSNKYYLVTIRMACPIPYTITVERGLDDSYGVPSYSTHAGGFSLLCKWQSNGGGWGTINPTRIVQAFAYSYSSVCPAGSIGQITESSEEYIYVRGGSVYNIRVDGTSYTDVNLRTATYTPYPDYPNSSRPGVVDSIVVPVVDLDTKASKDELLSTGIDISSRKIVLTSDKVVFQNNSGGQIALFENNKIKADLIDARAIVTGALIAEQIAATNITTGRLTVTDGAMVGGFRITSSTIGSQAYGDSMYLSRNGLSFRSSYKDVGIGDTLPSSTGVSNAVAGVFSTKLSSYDYQYGGISTLMVGTSGGTYGSALCIRTDNRNNDVAIDFKGRINTNGVSKYGGNYADFGLTGIFILEGVWHAAAGRPAKTSFHFVDGILVRVIFDTWF